jgi:hypothetical protein
VIATDTSEVGELSVSQSSVAPSWFSIAATTAFEPGVSGARPDVISLRAKPASPESESVADTTRNEPSPSRPSSVACCSGTGPRSLAPACSFSSFAWISATCFGGSVNSTSAWKSPPLGLPDWPTYLRHRNSSVCPSSLVASRGYCGR